MDIAPVLQCPREHRYHLLVIGHVMRGVIRSGAAISRYAAASAYLQALGVKAAPTTLRRMRSRSVGGGPAFYRTGQHGPVRYRADDLIGVGGKAAGGPAGAPWGCPMTFPQRMTDDEIDARASEIAEAVLGHPLWRVPWALRAIRDGDPASPLPMHARVIRMALAAIDAADDPPRAGDPAMTSQSAARDGEDLTLAEVAARLRKSKRWLQSLLAEDKRRRPDEQRFHFHGDIGRTPVWTEPQFQLLRAAVKVASAKESDGQPGLRSSNATAIGTFTGPSSRRDAESAFAEVLATGRQERTSTPTPSARIEKEIRGELAGRPRPGPEISIAAKAYLNRKRMRPLGRVASTW